MEWTKSNYELKPEIKDNAKKVAQKKGGAGGLCGHFPNARKDKTNYARC